jgi:hypothetical protein
MTIEFSCQCGKQVKVADKFAGRRAKCPACGVVLTIPAPEAPDDDIDGDLLYEALGVPADTRPADVAAAKCSGCGKPMPGDSVLCTHCGFHKITGTYIKTSPAGEAEAKERRGPLLVIAGIELTWLRIIVILLPIIGIPYWYYTGPGRDMHVREMQVVNVVRTIKSGDTQEPFSLFTQQGNMALGIKAPKSKSNPNPLIGGIDEIYSLGSSDELVVSTPDDKGDHVLLEVGLRQLTIRDAGQTALYDSIIEGENFKLVPMGGGTPIEAQVLYHRFDEGKAEVSLSGADTSNYKTLFPSEPTQLDVDSSGGMVDGKAYWNQPTAKGEITFYASLGSADAPPSKGLTANGKIEAFNDQGATVDMDYDGGVLNIAWDHDASGWWSKRRFDKMSSDYPWYRYEFGLLFKRPQAAGYYQVTYCDKKVAKIFLEEKPVTRPPTVSPIKRAKAQGQGGQGGTATNNPLAYFDVLTDARHAARGIVSASNLRQIGMGLQMYLGQNNQQWPDRLDRLESVIQGFDQIMVNPRTGSRPGFLYIKPERGADPASTAVVYENYQGQPDPNGAVLYADGHIE